MTSRLFVTFVILHSSFDILSAAPPPELTVLRTQYEKVLADKVTAPFDAALADLNTKFTTALDRIADEAKKAGKLDAVLAILEDKKRLASKLPLPEDDDATPDSLKKLRGIYREQMQKLEDQRTANHGAILPAYTAKLQALETTLTKADRIDEAKEIKDYRAGLDAGITPRVSATATTPGEKPAAASSAAPRRTFPPGDDRKAGIAAFDIGGTFQIKDGDKDKPIKKLEEVPEGPFEITRMNFHHGKPPAKPYRDLGIIAGLKSLRALTLDNFTAKDEDMEVIATLPALEEFYIPNPKGRQFTGSKLGMLMAPEKMKYMSFQGSPVGSKGVEGIGRCVNLQRLNLANGQMDDKDLRHLSNHTALTELDLRWTPTSITGIRHLKALKNLTDFGWGSAAKKGRAEWAEIASFFPLVTRVRLGNREGNTADDYAGIAAFPALKSVYLQSGAACKEALAGLATVPGLEKINGYWCEGLTDKALESLQMSKSLNVIGIDYAPNITGAGLVHLAKIPNLTVLVLGRCSGIKQADVDAFKQARPEVKFDFNK